MWRVLALLLWADAASPSVDACLEASSSAQRLRDEGRYVEARRVFTVCSNPECPAVVRADCTRAVEQLLGMLPSVVVIAREGERDLDGRLFVDGALAVDHLTGRPMDLDPGPHTLRVELADGRSAEQALIAAAGDKGRRISLAFEPLPTPAVPPAVPPAAPVVSELVRAPTGPPAFAIASSALSVGGWVTFAVLGTLGKAAERELLTSPCASARDCDPGKVQSAHDTLLGADIALGVGIAFAGIAAWQWLTWAAEAAP